MLRPKKKKMRMPPSSHKFDAESYQDSAVLIRAFGHLWAGSTRRLGDLQPAIREELSLAIMSNIGSCHYQAMGRRLLSPFPPLPSYRLGRWASCKMEVASSANGTVSRASRSSLYCLECEGVTGAF